MSSVVNLVPKPDENGTMLVDDGSGSDRGVKVVAVGSGLGSLSCLRERCRICSLEGYSQVMFRPTQLAHG